MDGRAVRRGFALLGVVMLVNGGCGSGDGEGGGDARRETGDSRTDGTAELVDDALVPESGEGTAAPDLINRDGGYQCSGTEDVTIEGEGLHVGLAADCASVTIRGTGNEVDLWEAATVVVEGRNHDVGLVSAFFESVRVSGERNHVHLNAADAVTVDGLGNTLDVVEGRGPITVMGAEHHIQVPENGSTPVTDRSVNSQIDGSWTEPVSATPPPAP